MLLKQPRARVILQGILINGLVEVVVKSPGIFLAGRFYVVVALGLSQELGVDEFVNMAGSLTTIEFSNNQNEYTLVMSGCVENILVDVFSNTVTIQGRDLTSILIDSNISETFVNQTASDIVESVAKKYNFIPNVSPTTDLVGQYYQIDHTQTSLNVGSRLSTTWNLLCRLAEFEGYCVYVFGNTLNFIPARNAVQRNIDRTDFLSLEFDILNSIPSSVSIRSWNIKEKRMVSEVIGSGSKTELIYPNIESNQAQKYGKHYLKQAQQQGRVLLGTMPGDTDLKIEQVFSTSGVNSSLCGNYMVTEICRFLNNKNGFFQKIKAFSVID